MACIAHCLAFTQTSSALHSPLTEYVAVQIKDTVLPQLCKFQVLAVTATSLIPSACIKLHEISSDTYILQ